MDAPLRMEVADCAGAALLRPVGTLDRATCLELRDRLVTCAAGEPRAVIVQLDELVVPQSQALSVFASVAVQMADWPGVPLLLVAERPQVRARLVRHAISRFVPIHPTLGAAVRSLARSWRRRRDRVGLPPVAASSTLARQFVTRVCRRWGVQWVTEDARMVATELVENVLQHTASAAELRLELTAGRLRVAVSDADPRPAVLREAVRYALPSTGLSIVARLSESWGCTPGPGGKTVWAVLRT